MPPKNTRSGALPLIEVRIAMKSVDAVGGVFARHHFAAGRLGRLLDFVGQPLTVGGAVVDDGDFLRAELGHGEFPSTLPCCASLVITR